MRWQTRKQSLRPIPNTLRRWSGTAEALFLSREHFQSGDTQKGIDLFKRGRKEMDTAVALEPDNVGVRIPRGAVLMAAGRGMSHETLEQGEKICSKRSPITNMSTSSEIVSVADGTSILWANSVRHRRYEQPVRQSGACSRVLRQHLHAAAGYRLREASGLWKETKSLAAWRRRGASAATPAAVK